MRIKLKQYLAKVQAKTKHSIYSNYLNCYKSPHLLLNHLCIHSFMHKSLQQTFWLCAFALCIHISNRILIDGRRRCVLSGLCSLSLQKRYLEDAAQLLQFAFTETSTTERGLGIQGIKLSLPLCSLSFLSKQQEHGFFSHRNQWDAESFSSIYSFPPIPLPSVYWLPGSLSLSVLSYLETVYNKEQ